MKIPGLNSRQKLNKDLLPSLKEQKTESRDVHTTENSDTCHLTLEVLILGSKVRDTDER